MALQTPFFGKREPEAFGVRSNLAQAQSLTPRPQPQATPPVAEAVDMPVAAAAAQPPAKATGSTLTVGPNIKLKGVEITDCDTLVVEGTVEATMDSRVIQIAQQGAFRGSADIDIAEIHGEFNGTLNVREKLVIFSTGKVTGKIRYGKLVVEEGGQLSGEIEMGVGKNMPRAAQTASASASPAVADSAATPQADSGTGEANASTPGAAASA